MSSRERGILGAALLWGLLVWGASLAIASRVTPAPRRGHWDASLERFATTAPLAHWDSYWYWRISEQGYETADDRRPHTTAFFPLYPLLLGAVRRATGIHPFLAGTPLSLAALAGAALAIARLAEAEGFDSRWSLAALLLFPKAVFFAAVMTEGVFLFLSAGCLLAARRGRPGSAAAFGFFAALTRPTGVVLSLALAVSARERSRTAGRAEAIRGWAAALAPIAGAAVFGAFLWLRFGSPFVGVHAEAAGWGHRILGWPWDPLLAAVRRHGREYRVGLLFIVPFALAGALLWRRRLRAEALYVLGSIALVIETGAFPSAPRYMLVLFPAFFVFGDVLRRFPAARWIYGVAGASLLGLEVYRFTLNYWVA